MYAVEVPWNSWEPWSNCSGSCVTGIQKRTRTCNSGFETVECGGLSTETRDCNEEDCSRECFVKIASFVID